MKELVVAEKQLCCNIATIGTSIWYHQFQFVIITLKPVASVVWFTSTAMAYHVGRAGMYPLNRAILRSPSLHIKSRTCAEPRFSRLDVGRWVKRKLSSIRAQGEPVICQHFSVSRHSGFISDTILNMSDNCTHPLKAKAHTPIAHPDMGHCWVEPQFSRSTG